MIPLICYELKKKMFAYEKVPAIENENGYFSCAQYVYEFSYIVFSAVPVAKIYQLQPLCSFFRTVM